MNEETGSKVDFSTGNVSRCQCPKCPVQAKSQCVREKLGTIDQALSKSPLLREDIPGVYCSTDKATCQDLDPTQSCICGDCPVFNEYGLAAGEPIGYFCKNGHAKGSPACSGPNSGDVPTAKGYVATCTNGE
ncbi:MAG: DUF2769 domain-containing protein [Syntrophorhabdaceae bacterium]